MSRSILPFLLLTGLLCLRAPCDGAGALGLPVSGHAATPPPGSPVRAAIMDALRAQVKRLLGTAYPKNGIEFIVSSVKVHGNWAYASVRPRAKSGRGQYEDLNELLRRTNGHWRVLDGPDFEAGDEQKLSEAQVLRRLHRKHPQAPADLF